MNAIGIIGQGFVGSAIREGFREHFGIYTFDIKEPNSITIYDELFVGVSAHEAQFPHEHLVTKVDGPIFVCLPTPMRGDGSCDYSLVRNTLDDLNYWAEKHDRVVDVIIKSTITPGTTQSLSTKYKNCRLCYNPEFLTEANAQADFQNQDRIILGYANQVTETKPLVSIPRTTYEKAFPRVPIVELDSTMAEMVKHVTNIFLATKVSLANEFAQICEKLGIDYSQTIATACLDERLGQSHWSAPGPDGHYGFGGSCFPKDLNSLIHTARVLGVPPTVMLAVWYKNVEV